MFSVLLVLGRCLSGRVRVGGLFVGNFEFVRFSKIRRQ
jgi:hypothetical protein